MTIPLVTIITVANVIIRSIDKLFYRFSVTNNTVLSECNRKGSNLKGGKKSPFNDFKICKAIKDNHEMSIILPIGWFKLYSGELN